MPSRRRSATSSATTARRSQVEDGEQYHELRGVMIEARTVIHRDIETRGRVRGERSSSATGAAPRTTEFVRRRSARRRPSASRSSSCRSGSRAGITASWAACTRPRSRHAGTLPAHARAQGPDPLRRQGHAAAADHPHERQAAGAGRQQAGAVLRDRGDGRRPGSRRSGSSSRRRPATRSGRPPATARGSASGSPTSSRTSRSGWPTPC